MNSPLNMSPDDLAAAVLSKQSANPSPREDGDADYITSNLMDAMQKQDKPRFKRSMRQLFDMWSNGEDDD